MPISFTAGQDPWWVEQFGAEVSDQGRALGTITLQLSRLETCGSQQLAGSGPLRFRTGADVPEGEILGRLYVDAHPDDEQVASDRVTVVGVVERIELIPIVFVLGDSMFEPREQLEPISVDSTLRRDRVPFDAQADRRVVPEILVWLRTPDE